jgi:hypothetical protein
LPTWGEILNEIIEEHQKTEKPPFDSVRRKYLKRLQEYTKRNVILYATKWTQAGGIHPELISITDEDVQGFMEAVHGLNGKLNLILHSPGGSLEATEALVTYLRSKFDHIKVIIPNAAMSAATLLSCAADEVVMGKHSFISPIDPQLILETPLGPQAVPAQAILEQFSMAKEECADPKKFGTWLPILGQYGPALLVQCKHALALAQELASEWLAQYMLLGEPNSKEKAEQVAARLTNLSLWKSHSRHISREEAKDLGLKITNLEDDQTLQDLVLSVFHSTTHTFSGTPAVKIIENHEGKAFIKHFQPITVKSSPENQTRVFKG